MIGTFEQLVLDHQVQERRQEMDSSVYGWKPHDHSSNLTVFLPLMRVTAILPSTNIYMGAQYEACKLLVVW